MGKNLNTTEPSAPSLQELLRTSALLLADNTNQSGKDLQGKGSHKGDETNGLDQKDERNWFFDHVLLKGGYQHLWLNLKNGDVGPHEGDGFYGELGFGFNPLFKNKYLPGWLRPEVNIYVGYAPKVSTLIDEAVIGDNGQELLPEVVSQASVLQFGGIARLNFVYPWTREMPFFGLGLGVYFGLMHLKTPEGDENVLYFDDLSTGHAVDALGSELGFEATLPILFIKPAVRIGKARFEIENTLEFQGSNSANFDLNANYIQFMVYADIVEGIRFFANLP